MATSLEGELTVINDNFPLPAKQLPQGRGRPKGSGLNQKLLARLEPGNLNQCIWGVSLRKKQSLKWTATVYGMKIKVRMIGDGKYCIWRLS